MSRKTFFVFISILTVATVVFFRVQGGEAQSSQPAVCVNPTTPEIAQACAEYAVESQKLVELQSQLNQQKQKSGSLQKNVNTLISQISSTQNKIKEKITSIGTLSNQISQKAKAIDDLSAELSREHQSLQQLIKKTNEIDQKGATYVLFSNDSVSDFYKDLDDFLSIKQSLYSSLDKIKQIKSLTEDQKEQLLDKQSQAQDAKAALESEKNN